MCGSEEGKKKKTFKRSTVKKKIKMKKNKSVDKQRHFKALRGVG